MGIEKIKEKIMSDAMKEAAKITSEAEAQSTEISHKNKAKIKEIQDSGQQEIDAAVKLYKDKTLAQARLDAKRNYLATRDEIIQDFIANALDGIQKSKDYSSYINDSIKDSSKLLTKDITIHCNKRDKKIVEEAVEFGKVKTGDVTSGVIIIDGTGKKIDLTIATKLESIKQQLTQDIVKLIGVKHD